MQPELIAVVIAVGLCAVFAVERVAEVRNLRALGGELPEEFRGVYDEETYRRTQRYTRDRTRLGMVAAIVDLAALLVFWAAGGFTWLDQWVGSLGLGPVPTGLVFVSALVVAQALLGLPFSIYGTFRLEARYGFNRTTPGVYVADLAKAVALAVVLGLPALAALIAFFTYLGPYAWLYAWGAAVAYMLVLEYVSPTWIMPLFNRFTPLEEGDLRDAITDYTASVGFPVRSVLVMDGSRRSTKANAFFTGFGRTRRIALFDTLISQHPQPQLMAVIAHEVGHYKRHHVQQGLLVSVAHTGVLLALLSVCLTWDELFGAFGVPDPSVWVGQVLFGVVLGPAESVLSVGLHALSRHNERQADEFSARTTGDPDSMVDALKTLSRNTLTNLTPDPLYVRLNYSHPPVLERISLLRRRSARSAQG